MPSIDLVALRRAVLGNRYLITTHAMRRMGLRKVSHEDVKRVIAGGDVIEQYPDNLPDPKILLMTHLRRNQSTFPAPSPGAMLGRNLMNQPAICPQCGGGFEAKTITHQQSGAKALRVRERPGSGLCPVWRGLARR